MAVINTTQVKVARTVVSTTPDTTAGQTTGRGDHPTLINVKLDVPKATIRYELIKENLGDTPDAAYAFEKTNVGVIHTSGN